MTLRRETVLLVGASGVIGRAVKTRLDLDFDVITAGIEQADVFLDITDASSLTPALAALGALDHVVCTAGRAAFAPLSAIEVAEPHDSRYWTGLADKLMGQVNLALAARSVLEQGGSVVLTTGTTRDEPILGGSSLSMVNGALEAWVQAAATEFPAGLRLNAVSPGFVAESPPQAHAAFPGFRPIPAQQVAEAYLRCLRSGLTGRTIKVE